MTERAQAHHSEKSTRLANWLLNGGETTAGEALVESLLKLGGRPLVDRVAVAAGIDQCGGMLDLIDKLDAKLREPWTID